MFIILNSEINIKEHIRVSTDRVRILNHPQLELNWLQ